jgi:hypothetical protein
MERLFVGVSASIFLFLLSANAQSQTPGDSLASVEATEEMYREELLEQTETESDENALLDFLTWLQEHPLNLNTATREELSAIPRLTPQEIKHIVALRTKLKRFTSVQQLAWLEGGEEILAKVRPYVTVAASDQVPVALTFVSRTVHDLQQRRGFREGKFIGSAFKNYNRMTVVGGDFQAGALYEKDAGERFADGYASGYLSVRDWLFLSNAIVGDYIVEAGQGLVLWQASAFGKGSDGVAAARKSARGPQPYRSSDEFTFLRGVALKSALTFDESTVLMSGFVSRRTLAASGTDEAVTSFYRDGFFRTDTELQKRASVVEKLFGGRLEYISSGAWRIGTTAYRAIFSKPIASDRTFEFSGSASNVAGIDAEINLGWLAQHFSEITLFGELARSGNDGFAGIAGSVFHFTQTTSLALLYRDYSPRFSSLHATGFGEGTATKNERGFYLALETRPARWLRVSGYLDHFRFPWRTFDNPLPTSGRDFLLQVGGDVSRPLHLVLRYANKTTETVTSSVDQYTRETRVLTDRVQQRVRLSATYRASSRVRLKARIETVHVEYTLAGRSERGYLFYQEFQYAAPSAFTAEARLIFFDTKSYDSRVYEFENDLRGVFSNPALYGKGRRWYVLVRWSVGAAVGISAKYSETQKDAASSLGSGLMEIPGDVDNRISLQLELKL